MLRALRRVLRPARPILPARPLSAGMAVLPPTARDALGTETTPGEAIAYNRSRVATATALALHRSRTAPPLTDQQLDDAVRGLAFPYSRPSGETRAAIRAALAVLDADPTLTLTD
ncbi:hypothetical protein [Streptomyces sp. NPDC093094]|uniref:hypothetical protein n=1 Tax=Streptomyces sp. NPDC093094 TaxID=3366026 RepID=UPI00381187D2